MQDYEDKINIAVCGPVDAGKSTLIGVLTSGILDNGNGLARQRILTHKHELESGRTSNITYNPLIYEKTPDKLLIKMSNNGKIKKIKDIDYEKETENDNNLKIVQLLDLAGHEKYFKTTVYGITGLFPDYGFVIIGANTGITKLTREHLELLLHLGIPTTVVITKIDYAPKHIYERLKKQVDKLLSKYGKKSFHIAGEFSDKLTGDYIETFFNRKKVIPVTSISNKTGENINNLHKIIYNIKPNKAWNNKQEIIGSIFYIDTTFQVPGIGLVLSGILKGDSIKKGQQIYLGPYYGKFYKIVIRSIHNSIRQNIDIIHNGMNVTIAIKFTNPKEALNRKQIIKGMICVDNSEKWKKNVVKEFKAKVRILHHSTTITNGYTPVIHCGPIRQSAKITNTKKINKNKKTIEKNDDYLRTGDDCILSFKFIQHSEFMENNMIFFFRDGTTKGVGKVLNLEPCEIK